MVIDAISSIDTFMMKIVDTTNLTEGVVLIILKTYTSDV